MPRAKGRDLGEIFGFAPDDVSDLARKQWKRQECPFIGGICIKHSHPQANGTVVVYGSCSVVNNNHGNKEEVIICPQRLYAGKYTSLRQCVVDATGKDVPIYLAHEYSTRKRKGKLPDECVVMLGHNSGKEISVRNPDISLSLDWVLAHVRGSDPIALIPCEVQSIDTTGNYRDNWTAYAEERLSIPDSGHGMNWANVWKRLIPQLILKGSIAMTSTLCAHGLYFIVPDRVFMQFEKLLGKVPRKKKAGRGVITIATYVLGPQVPAGYIRSLDLHRVLRMTATDLAKTFASGKQLPLGSQLDEKVSILLGRL